MVSVEEVLDDNDNKNQKSGNLHADSSDSATDTTSQDHTSSNDDRLCRVCGVVSCSRRCSLCKLAYYCSVDCQKIDWTKGGHRRKCPGNTPKSTKANGSKSKNPVMGPSIPPPTTVRNEDDARRVLQELWSIADSAIKKETKMDETAPQESKPIQPMTPKAYNPKLEPPNASVPVHNKDEREERKSDQQEIQNVTFVAEEMPQICRFQLTLTKIQPQDCEIQESSIRVSTNPMGWSGSQTMVSIRENDQPLFEGVFPRPIRASDVTWSVSNCKTPGETTLVIRLPYPYDPSNTSSLALGGSLDDSYCESSDATLDEINAAVCGTCHLALLGEDWSNPSRSSKISRTFPLPQGHWDEIADYLICYDGQPTVDFSAGSECAEPSIALQDASLLCFHRKDVEQAVCALAVDGYGESNNDDNNSNSEDHELGKFVTKPQSFVLTEEINTPQTDESTTTTAAAAANNDPEISATSAVVRGDRTWQDAVDGESISLCCSRCSSPLGFASLTSPETWRFWKHRLAIQLQDEKQVNDKTKQNKNEIVDFQATMSFATNIKTSNTTAKPSRLQIVTALPVVKPMASCTSFLAKELVRYAESKAIFTFVIRRETTLNETNDCLLLRLLSWETGMATSYKSNSKQVLFRKVAKIVFEVTTDPTREGNSQSHDTNSGEAPTQWFWGGVDLCCPPPTQTTTSTTDPPSDAVSTARLELPNDEYDLVLKDLVAGKSLVEPEIAKATILLKMGGLSEGLGLTAVSL